MGTKQDNFIIISGSLKDLTKARKKAVKIFSSHKELRGFRSCIGNVSGGVNGCYFMTLTPTGSQYGWDPGSSFEAFLETFKTYLTEQEINYDELILSDEQVYLDNNYHRKAVKSSYSVETNKRKKS